MHIYAFGSLCRGDIAIDSDIDLLAITGSFNHNLSASTFSIYSYRRIQELWNEGSPFAWHLSAESRLIYSHNSTDFIVSLGTPSQYKNAHVDCNKFYSLFNQTISAINDSPSIVYNFSIIFLCIRNFATCFSLGYNGHYNFSRHSAINMGDDSIKISPKSFEILERARILSTRGIGDRINDEDISEVIKELSSINLWFEELLIRIL